jgi:outer membrane lipopolysaccharide assembly protein LptE/RlpB
LPSAFATVRVDSTDEYTDFYRELQRSLAASGVQTTEQANTRAVLRVQRDSFGQRVAAVSPRNTPEEFQVFYAVDYSVTIDGVEIAPTEHLELTTNYSYDPSAILAKQHEQRTIQQALARELANIVLRRLATVQLRATP